MADFKILSRILGRLRNIFELRRGAISVGIGENLITLAETAVSKGRTETVRLVARPIDLKSGEDAAGAIKAVFESLNISRRRIRLNIPRHLVSVRLLRLPSTDDDEIGKMVQIESFKHVPYAGEEAVSGYRVVEKFNDGYSSVLVAVAQAGTIKALTDLFGKAGLAVEFVSLGSEALLLWYLCARPGPEDLTVLLLNVDMDHINIDVVAGNKLVFTRGVSFGSHSEMPAEKIIEQINISTSAYRKESGKVVDKGLITGIPKKVDELKGVLVDKLAFPIDVLDQMNNIPIGKAADLESDKGSFAELLGLSLRFQEARINLLPKSAQEANRLESVKKSMSISLAVLAMMTAVVFVAVAKRFHDKRVCISYIDSEFRKMGEDLKNAKKIARQVNVIKAKLAHRPFAIDILSEIFKITPSGISLSLMEFESGKTMALRGSAPSLGDVFKYVAALQRSPYLGNIKVKYANKRTLPGAGLTDFEIIASVVTVNPVRDTSLSLVSNGVKEPETGKDAHKKVK